MLRRPRGSGSSGSGRGSRRTGTLRNLLGESTDLRSLRASMRDVFRRSSRQEVAVDGELVVKGEEGASKEEEVLDGTPVNSDRSSDVASPGEGSAEDGAKEGGEVASPPANGGEDGAAAPRPQQAPPPTTIEIDATASGSLAADAPSPRPKRRQWGEATSGDSSDDLLTESKLKASGDDYDGTETLSRNHPVFEMLRQRKAGEAMAHARALEAKEGRGGAHHVLGQEDDGPLGSVKDQVVAASKGESSAPLPPPQAPTAHQGKADECRGASSAAAWQEERASCAGKGYLDRLVLKFTTYSQSNETPSYVISKAGGKIGRGVAANTVAVPTDTTLQEEAHAVIDFKDGNFFLVNRGAANCAAIRIGSGLGQREWPLPVGSAFSAGNSVFVVKELQDGSLVAEVIDGPLKGQEKKVTSTGATLGRSPDNTLSISDPELSRRHSKIEYEEEDGKYYLCDVGSTNGTYVQLVGPYAGTYKLTLSDQIMVGRTGFSINRFDYGISEERGRRKTMEDHTVVIQDLGLLSLQPFGLAPQTMAAVFDGHGGEYASAYLSTHLHVNLSADLEAAFKSLLDSGRDPSTYSVSELDALVTDVATKAFVRTDREFLETSPHPEAGSTGTVALLLGNRVYSCNVGDSRTIMVRKGQLHLTSKDHKPGREDEARRIKEAGGFIFQNRVMGELAVSRAFGDKELKKSMPEILGADEFAAMVARDAKTDQGVVKDYSQPLLIARPEVLVTDLTPDDDFLLLACDGLFDVFSNQEVVDYVRQEMSQHKDSQRTCENLSHTAIHTRVAHDNVSIVLLILNPWW